jgi:hypothetical protein
LRPIELFHPEGTFVARKHARPCSQQLCASTAQPGPDKRFAVDPAVDALYITFNEPIEVSAYGAVGLIEVKTSGSRDESFKLVVGTEEVRIAGETMMLTPPFPLRPNARYSVKVPSGILTGQRTGTELGADLKYWFITNAPTASEVRIATTVMCATAAECSGYASYLGAAVGDQYHAQSLVAKVRTAVENFRFGRGALTELGYGSDKGGEGAESAKSEIITWEDEV